LPAWKALTCVPRSFARRHFFAAELAEADGKPKEALELFEKCLSSDSLYRSQRLVDTIARIERGAAE